MENHRPMQNVGFIHNAVYPSNTVVNKDYLLSLGAYRIFFHEAVNLSDTAGMTSGFDFLLVDKRSICSMETPKT